MNRNLAPKTGFVNPAYTLVRAFLNRKSEATLTAYQSDLEHFSEFLGVNTLTEAAKRMISLPHGQANFLALTYKADMEKQGFKPTTINRRLSALRSLIALGNTLGVVSWKLEVKNIPVEPYRDTRGPGLENYQKMLMANRNQPNQLKVVRDHAILRLLYDLGLRRGSVTGLDFADLDIGQKRLWVELKQRSQKKAKHLPEATLQALLDWIEIRGTDDGPMFTNFDNARKGERLTGTSVYRIVRKLGEQIGIVTRPHGIRHTSITECVKQSREADIGLEEVSDFSDHKDLKTLLIYRDRERNVQGTLSNLISDR